MCLPNAVKIFLVAPVVRHCLSRKKSASHPPRLITAQKAMYGKADTSPFYKNVEITRSIFKRNIAKWHSKSCNLNITWTKVDPCCFIISFFLCFSVLTILFHSLRGSLLLPSLPTTDTLSLIALFSKMNNNAFNFWCSILCWWPSSKNHNHFFFPLSFMNWELRRLSILWEFSLSHRSRQMGPTCEVTASFLLSQQSNYLKASFSSL